MVELLVHSVLRNNSVVFMKPRCARSLFFAHSVVVEGL